ncbi:hypothetical protein DRN67_03185 [Candidatus Micrarchaeota archaeon]|nr:MAG: hypothetical protein DRN67_03185 [Candidatus Micrarchaeota archaeon]
MPPKVAKKKQSDSEIAKQMPKLEQEIKKISNELMGARIRGNEKKVKELEIKLNEKIKSRRGRDVLHSTPVKQVEKKGGETSIPVEGRVSGSFLDGSLSYSQADVPALSEEQLQHISASKIKVRYSA